MIVFLDQNKWIEIAKAIKKPEVNQPLADLVPVLVDAVRNCTLILPLTFTNLYETTKLNKPE
jgi:hypothetical protein